MSLAQANNHLAVKLHRMLAEEKRNVFFSPLSISTAMAMLVCAAEGDTESEMRAALGHDHAGLNKNNTLSAFEKQMSIFLQNSDSYTLTCANAMLSQKGFEIKEGYKKLLSESFKALLLEADFKNENEKAAAQINEWVKEKTNSMISELVESLDPLTVVVLLNAVYFKGTWQKKFEKTSTYRQSFYNYGSEDNYKQIDMMHQKEYFPFYEDEDFKVLELPYIGRAISMIIILPIEDDGLESVESNLTPSFFLDLKEKLVSEEVVVSLPRFRLEYTKALIPCFQRLGIERAFNRGAELGVASDSPELAVSEILHKAVLEVNEEGSEAAAVTAVGISIASITEFTADHPFAFVIYDTRSDLILFMGRVYEL